MTKTDFRNCIDLDWSIQRKTRTTIEMKIKMIMIMMKKNRIEYGETNFQSVRFT